MTRQLLARLHAYAGLADLALVLLGVVLIVVGVALVLNRGAAFIVAGAACVALGVLPIGKQRR